MAVVFEYMTKKAAVTECRSHTSVACFSGPDAVGRRSRRSKPKITRINGHLCRVARFRIRSPIVREAGAYARHSRGITNADFWGWGELASRENRVIQTPHTLAGPSATHADIATRPRGGR